MLKSLTKSQGLGISHFPNRLLDIYLPLSLTNSEDVTQEREGDKAQQQLDFLQSWLKLGRLKGLQGVHRQVKTWSSTTVLPTCTNFLTHERKYSFALEVNCVPSITQNDLLFLSLALASDWPNTYSVQTILKNLLCDTSVPSAPLSWRQCLSFHWPHWAPSHFVPCSSENLFEITFVVHLLGDFKDSSQLILITHLWVSLLDSHFCRGGEWRSQWWRGVCKITQILRDKGRIYQILETCLSFLHTASIRPTVRGWYKQ